MESVEYGGTVSGKKTFVAFELFNERAHAEVPQLHGAAVQTREEPANHSAKNSGLVIGITMYASDESICPLRGYSWSRTWLASRPRHDRIQSAEARW